MDMWEHRWYFVFDMLRDSWESIDTDWQIDVVHSIQIESPVDYDDTLIYTADNIDDSSSDYIESYHTVFVVQIYREDWFH